MTASQLAAEVISIHNADVIRVTVLLTLVLTIREVTLNNVMRTYSKYLFESYIFKEILHLNEQRPYGIGSN